MTELRRDLGVIRGLGLTLGVIVGSGVFVLPAYVASLLPNAQAFLWIWAIGGVLSLATALCYAELATTFPETGGYVVFVRRVFGDRLAFLYGWAAMFVIWPSSIAGLARVFGSSIVDLLGRGAESLFAVFLIAAAAVINVGGVGLSSRAQVALTSLKVSLLAALAVAGIAGMGSSPPVASAPVASAAFSASAWFLGLIAVFWCYEGFLEIVAVAGEVRRPRRTLVWVLVGGVVIITTLYTGFAWALLQRVGMQEMAGHDAIAAELARRILGPAGGRIVSGVVALATASAVLSLLFSGPRILVAMANSQLFFPRGGQVDAGRGTPGLAVVLLAVMAAAYASVATFVELVKYFSFVTGLFSVLIVAGGAWLRLRGRVPQQCRRIPLWPLPVIASLTATLGGVFYIWRDQPRASTIGLLLLILAIPASAGVRRRLRSRDVALSVSGPPES